MKHKDVAPQIADLCRSPDLSFGDRCAAIANLMGGASEAELLEHLDHAGVIPESFGHDSTEEKLYAKYCDSLLAACLSSLGMDARAIPERSDAADVEASCDGYRIVGDAKAFRLSRTAKNQKDFKVEALNSWRKGAEYACLVAPLYQYPSRVSQIYEQATRCNVTLLSYAHLAFALRRKPDPRSLRSIWEVGRQLPRSKAALAYWNAIDETICEIAGATRDDWKHAVVAEKDRLPLIAAEQIEYWEREKERIGALPKDIAVAELIAALKIDSKIEMIRRNSGLDMPTSTVRVIGVD